MSSISSLVVGLGHIGLGYDLESQGDTVFTHTEACRHHPEVELVAGVDIDSQARERFTKHAEVPAYSTIEEFQNLTPRVDLVIVSTPTDMREQVVRESLDLSPKAILIEKPLAASVDEGTRIVAMCNERSVPLAVNYIRRFDAAIMDVPREAKARSFGQLQLVNVFYSGDLLTNASHYVDLLTAWFRMPNEVVPLKGESGSADGGVSFVMKFGNLDAYVHSVEASYGIGEVDLLFEKGRARLVDHGETIEWSVSGPDPFFPEYLRLAPLRDGGSQPGMERYQYQVLEAMVRTIRDGAALPSTGDSALGVLALCESLGRA